MGCGVSKQGEQETGAAGSSTKVPSTNSNVGETKARTTREIRIRDSMTTKDLGEDIPEPQATIVVQVREKEDENASSSKSNRLTILHFNDVYNIEPRDKEPVGGAARFAHKLASYKHLNPLTVFSGDVLNPSTSGIIMFGGVLLFDEEFIHVVSITFTSLILTELLMVALTIRTWHWLMVVAELVSLGIYVASLVLLRSYFDESFLISTDFISKVVVITLISFLPLYILNSYLRRKYAPPSYSKLT